MGTTRCRAHGGLCYFDDARSLAFVDGEMGLVGPVMLERILGHPLDPGSIVDVEPLDPAVVDRLDVAVRRLLLSDLLPGVGEAFAAGTRRALDADAVRSDLAQAVGAGPGVVVIARCTCAGVEHPAKVTLR